MFKNLLQYWKGKDFLSNVLNEFKNMLDDAQDMFNAVCKKLFSNQETSNLKENIYKIDRKINEIERKIRQQVISHLSVQPSVDVPLSLILMSVVKDAERLGDYAKNLLEVTVLIEQPINNEQYKRIFNKIEANIVDLFRQTKKAFIDSDEDKAEKSWILQREIKNECDQVIKKVSQSNLSVNEAVCFALTARYLKRIASHLTNIATSVILPVSDLDYFDEKRKKDEDV